MAVRGDHSPLLLMNLPTASADPQTYPHTPDVLLSM
jgi:hypothetical protein